MAAPTQTPSHHVVSRAVASMHGLLDQVADSSTWSMDPDETAATLASLTRLTARVAELELRVAAHAQAGRVGEAAGATSVASWWAHASRQTRPETHRKLRLAGELADGHETVRGALSAGDLVTEQARAIVDAVDQLPGDLAGELVEKAEAYLVEQAAHFDARALKILGRGLLEVVAPEAADDHEARLLAREEREAAAALRFTMAEDGHGRVRGRFTLDALHGAMLRRALLAFAAPRHRAATHAPGADGPTGGPRPGPERMGRAFGELIERYPVDRLPDAGGLAATVVITMDVESLAGGLKAAHLDTGDKISAALVRRLACEAGIIPAVLGTSSEVLDLGRRTRFHTAPMRTALALRDRGCTADGCDIPPALCHAHHDRPWSRGGATSVANGRLLCPRHHARAHDPAFTMTRLPGGKVAFARRC